jgi:hypothetical protein
MFENSILVSAIIRDIQRNEAEADRRAFHGPDAPPAPENRRKARGARLFRRITSAN